MERSKLAGRGGLVLLILCSMAVAIDLEPLDFSVGVLSCAAFTPILVLAAATGPATVRRVWAILVLALGVTLSLGERLEFGLGAGTAVAFSALIAIGAPRRGPAAIGMGLIALGAALGGVRIIADLSELARFEFTVAAVLVFTGALCFGVSGSAASISALTGALIGVAASEPLGFSADLAGDGAVRFIVRSIPATSLLALVLIAAALSGVREALLRRTPASPLYAGVATALLLLGLWPGAADLVLAPLWGAALDHLADLTSASAATPGVTMVTVTGTRVPAGAIPADFVMIGFGAVLLGLSLRHAALAVLMVVAAGAVGAGFSPGVELRDHLVDHTLIGLIVAAAVLISAGWVGPSQVHGAAVSAEQPGAALDAGSVEQGRGWSAFNRLRRRLHANPDAVRAFAGDPGAAPLKLKLAETFYAGLPALTVGLAIAMAELALGARWRIDYGQAGDIPVFLAIYALENGLNYGIAAYAVPVLFLVVAALSSWPLASGMVRSRQARRLYLSFDGVHGLAPQAMAALAATLLGFTQRWIDYDPAAPLAMGAGFAAAGLLVVATPWLFWLNAIRIPWLTARTFGARGAGMVFRMALHYVFAAVAVTLASGALFAASYGLSLAVGRLAQQVS